MSEIVNFEEAYDELKGKYDSVCNCFKEENKEVGRLLKFLDEKVPNLTNEYFNQEVKNGKINA